MFQNILLVIWHSRALLLSLLHQVQAARRLFARLEDVSGLRRRLVNRREPQHELARVILIRVPPLPRLLCIVLH